jgi:ribonuclease Z
MLEIIFLGTSASVPTASRSLPATLVKCQGERYLVDCGEGAQLRLMQATEDLNVSHILLTHDHLDHWLGLAGLLFSLSIRRLSPAPKIAIYGGDTTLQKIDTLYSMVRSKSSEKVYLDLEYIEIVPGIILDNAHLTIRTFPTNHRERACFGYVFESKGPKSVKVVFTGDTGYFEDLIQIAADADCLICEANFLSEKEDLAKKVGHLTAAQAASIAAQAGVKKLLLNHISREYASNMDVVRAEAQKLFPQTIIPRDLDRLTVDSDGLEYSSSCCCDLCCEVPTNTASSSSTSSS